MRWLWLAGAGLFGVAALAVFLSFRDPVFVAGLTAAAVSAAFEALKPGIAKPMSEADTKAKDAAYRRGQGDNWIRRRLGSLRDR